MREAPPKRAHLFKRRTSPDAPPLPPCVRQRPAPAPGPWTPTVYAPPLPSGAASPPMRCLRRDAPPLPTPQLWQRRRGAAVSSSSLRRAGCRGVQAGCALKDANARRPVLPTVRPRAYPAASEVSAGRQRGREGATQRHLSGRHLATMIVTASVGTGWHGRALPGWRKAAQPWSDTDRKEGGRATTACHRVKRVEKCSRGPTESKQGGSAATAGHGGKGGGKRTNGRTSRQGRGPARSRAHNDTRRPPRPERLRFRPPERVGALGRRAHGRATLHV